MYDDSDCPPENDGYEVPNKPDWNQKNQANTSKTSESVKTDVNGSVNSNLKNVDDLTSETVICEKQDNTDEHKQTL